MSVTSTCSICGMALPPDAPKAFCPRCLFRIGFEDLAEWPPLDQQTAGDSRSEGAATCDFPKARPFGDYELLEEIGHGGMGVVYKARQKSLDRTVALKLLLFGPHAPPESVKRFRSEAMATAALQHPNIVAIHEVGFFEGQHFIAMDYVEGRQLGQIIADFGFRVSDFQRIARWVRTIADAIHHAHEHGILHRDLKPSNVMIDANDQPRVTDFGLAKRLEGDPELTVTGQMLGSPSYMPPEQASGKRGAVSRQSDVYALGATLYQALTGRPPFVSESMADTVEQVLHLEPVAPRVLNPSLPIDLETVCLKCLEKEPGKRYVTAKMLAEELQRFLDGQPVLARPIGLAGKLGRWYRRNPILAAVATVAVSSVLLGLGGIFWQWRRAATGELLARQNAYAADMRELQGPLEKGELGTARGRLNNHRPKGKFEVDLRGWEWRYFWSRCQSDELFTLWQYSNSVSVVAFSPDGQWLAVRRGDDTVALWDTAAKRQRTELPAHGQRWCRALAFSPRANLLAWGNQEAAGTPTVSLWHVPTQKTIASLPHSAAVASIAFAPDANEMAALAHDGTVRVWDLDSLTSVTWFRLAAHDASNGQRRATGQMMATSAAEADLGPTGREPPPSGIRFTTPTILTGHYGCVRFSPNGRWLAAAEARPRIHLRDRTHGQEKIIPVPPPATGITALAFSPDSQWLAAACGAGDNDIHLWDLLADKHLQISGQQDIPHRNPARGSGGTLGHNGTESRDTVIPGPQTHDPGSIARRTLAGLRGRAWEHSDLGLKFTLPGHESGLS